jgi:hypothetical protein
MESEIKKQKNLNPQESHSEQDISIDGEDKPIKRKR